MMMLQKRVTFQTKTEQERRTLPEMPELPALPQQADQEEDDSWLNDSAASLSQSRHATMNETGEDETIRLSTLEQQARQAKHEATSPLRGQQPASALETRGVMLDRQAGTAAMPSGEYIGVGHPLWPLVLRLSEHIWHELYQRPDVTSTPDLLLVELVRKRAIDLLKAEPKSAGQVHDLTEAERLLHSVVNETLGYGPLEPLMKDEHVYEITVIGPRFAYIERDGQVEDVECRFEDDRHMQRIIENMLRRGGRRLPPGWPLIDARLPDGTLINIVLPPAAVNGPAITVRKRTGKPLTLADLTEMGTLSPRMADYLRACVQARRNIVVCGDVASGRTTLLNALCEAIPPHERVTTIEEAAELQLSQKHVVSLVSQLTGADGPGGVTLRDLVRHALRGGSERIVLGECRGDETLELLQAMYSGLNGALLCVYGNALKDCLAHLETLCLAAGTSMPAEMIRSQLAATLDVIVHVGRLRDGSRKVINIAEVRGFEASAVKLQSVYYYRLADIDAVSGRVHGEFIESGFAPAANKPSHAA